MKTFGIIALIVSLVCQVKADTVVINPRTTGGKPPPFISQARHLQEKCLQVV